MTIRGFLSGISGRHNFVNLKRITGKYREVDSRREMQGVVMSKPCRIAPNADSYLLRSFISEHTMQNAGERNLVAMNGYGIGKRVTLRITGWARTRTRS